MAKRTPPIEITLEDIVLGRETHTIVVVEPDPCYITRRDRVEWFCREGLPFAIHFDPLSPLQHRRLRSSETEGGTRVEEAVRGDILPGKYRYLVAVFHNGEIYTEDPELIDENN